MNLERKCAVAPVCGITCENCPAMDIYAIPVRCRVLSAVIRAFQAQEDYWKRKMEAGD